MTRQRLTREERRDAIVRAVVPVFAECGFHGSTTKELAKAAGVSEALLYKHFPSKESLYDEISQQHMEDREIHPRAEAILAMPPSTRRLVASVQHLIAHMAAPEPSSFARMMGQSLLHDGTFARRSLGCFQREFIPFIEESVKAARNAGDLYDDADPTALEGWFVHHVGFSLKMLALPATPAPNYDKDRNQVVRHAVRFALRGLGLKPGPIRKHMRSVARFTPG